MPANILLTLSTDSGVAEIQRIILLHIPFFYKGNLLITRLSALIARGKTTKD